MVWGAAVGRGLGPIAAGEEEEGRGRDTLLLPTFGDDDAAAGLAACPPVVSHGLGGDAMGAVQCGGGKKSGAAQLRRERQREETPEGRDT